MRRWQLQAACVAAAGLLAGCQSFSQTIDAVSGGPAEPAAPLSYPREPEVRVRIAGAVSKREIAGPPTLVLRPTSGSTTKPTLVTTPVMVTSSAEGIAVADAAGRIVTFPFGTDMEIAPAPEHVSQTLRVEKVRLPGFATIRPAWSAAPTTFDVIATMPVESYLPGVLTGEMPSAWPRQAYECQAVAARTYALHERERARREGRVFDVEVTTADQVYDGSTGLAAPNEAARATRGMVIATQGRVLRAYFSSTCGGRAASAAQVWPTGPGYEFNLAKPIQGKDRPHHCQASKWYRWETTRTDTEAGQRLRTWGRANKHAVAGIATPREIECAQRNAAGRPDRFRVTDDAGREFMLSAEELRFGLNQVVQGQPPVTVENRVNSGDLETEVWANKIRVRGQGWGHGVGMCQYCAKGMAEAGMDWASMIKLFYPGADVTKAY